MSLNTREVLNHYISHPFTPFTVSGVKEQLIQVIPADATNVKELCVAYLNNVLKQLISAINLPLLQEIKKSILTNAQEKMDIENFQISPTPTLEEVSVILKTVHQYAQKIQLQKEEVMHFISIFNSAKGYVSSFKTACEIILREMTETRKDLKNIRDALLNDLEVYEVFLKTSMKELNAIIEEVLSARSNLCFKLESSVRLLEKYRPIDEKIAGFNIQKM